MRKRVFVTGIGIVPPLRPFEGVDRFWSALCAGESAVRKMGPPLVDLGGEWLMAGVEASAFPDSLNVEDKAGFMVTEALHMALDDSGIDLMSLPDNSTAGLALGTVLGNVLYKEKRMMAPPAGAPDAMMNTPAGDSLTYIASALCSEYGFSGPCLTVSTACASGTDAAGVAARKVAAGKADIMIAGGIDVLSDFAVAGFDSLQAITRDQVRPFDRNRSGLALGEGAAFIILESEEYARKRGAAPYGEVLGYASRSDANHLTGPHRDGRGLASAIEGALSGAGVNAKDIDYINVHGTGTVYNDLMETKALKSALGGAAYDIPLSSTKSMLGHSFGAAGIIEAVCCLLAIRTGVIPPTANYRDRDPECDLDYVPNEARSRDVKTAMSQSAGFGGQNSVIIFSSL